jgi:hypothetical protein
MPTPALLALTMWSRMRSISKRLLVSLVLVLGLPLGVQAQIAHDVTLTTTYNGGASTTFDSAAFTVASSGSLITVTTCVGNPGTPPTVTGVNLDPAGANTAFTSTRASVASPDTDHRLYHWYLENVASGSHTIRVTKDSNGTNAAAITSVFSGTATSSSVDGTPSGTNGTSAAPAPGTISGQAQSDSLAVGGVLTESTSGTATLTAGTNDGTYTLPATGANKDATGGVPVCGQEYRLNPGDTSNNPNWTSDNLGWAAIGATFKIAGGGGGGAGPNIRFQTVRSQ